MSNKEPFKSISFFVCGPWKNAVDVYTAGLLRWMLKLSKTMIRFKACEI